MVRTALAFLLVAAVASVAGGCADLVPPPANAPRVVGGFIDLTSWDFAKNGPVSLDGQWDFLWHSLPDVNGNDDVTARHGDAHLHVPGQWDSVGFAPLGYGTFRARVALPSSPRLALAKSHADSAYNVIVDVDGARSVVLGIGDGGDIGVDADHERPRSHYGIGELPVLSKDGARDVVILSAVSNFSYPRGGEGASTYLGTREQLEGRRDAQRQRDFMIVGFLLITGVYHLVLFALRRSERAPLYFGLFCVLLACRTLERGRHLEDLWSQNDVWLLTKRVEYVGFFLAVPFFVAYLDALLGGAMNQWAKRAFIGAFTAMALLVVVTPPVIFGHTAGAAQVGAVASIAWMLGELARGFKKTRDAALLVVLLGFVILGATVVLDILSNGGVIGLPVITPLGQAVFVVSQAAVIASTNARARRRSEELATELMRMSKLKDEFLANTSHELRTPLNAIINIPHGLLSQIEERSVIVCRGCGALFEHNVDDDDSGAPQDGPCPSCGKDTLAVEVRRFAPDDGDALAAHLRSIIGSGEHLLAVVNDILDSSKLAAGTLELVRRDLPLKDVVDDGVRTVAPLALSAGIALTVNIDPALRVSVDKTRFVQVVINLVTNAVKFSPAGAAVVVDAKRDGAFVVLRVVDRGVGIAPEHHALIFESFRQIEGGHTRKHGGTGLGLAIVRQLVELHGGTVHVDSALGKGAVFTVRLPA